MHSPALFVVAAVMMMVATGCSKKEDPAASTAPPNSSINIAFTQGGGPMAAPESTVTRYSEEGPEIGTVTLRRSVIARRSADQSSDIVGRPGVGTAVNKKARKGPYYLIEFPSASGQMALGWAAQDDVNATSAAAVVATASASATTTTAASAPVIGRPVLTAAPIFTGRGRPPVVTGRH